MAVLHFRQGRLYRHRQPRRPFSLAVRGCWNQPDPFGLATAILLTGIGLAFLAGFVGMEFVQGAPADFPLLFLGFPFLVFGGMLLLLILIEFIYRRLKRIQSHCGRCRFYQALDAGYGLGRCRADPREAVVHRTYGCSFFDYSERAMVRDRFAQQAEIAARRRGNDSIQSPI
ncbi:MAG TPA: hypothetical protein VH599_00715 [Ktedonobacterales bacterium]|jgi:hypothetical protein